MFQLNCGCGGPLYIHELNIDDDFRIKSDLDVKLPNTTDRISCLKRKVINDYLDIINQLECGIQPDIENILLEISLIAIETLQDVHISHRVIF